MIKWLSKMQNGDRYKLKSKFNHKDPKQILQFSNKITYLKVNR